VKSKAIPVTLVGGYLGSGKTTLINHLLSEQKNQRIAVLVNDFGDLAIDAELINLDESNIVSLSGGCVCCSYGNDLTNALLDVLAMTPAPEHIVIEASGVALPGAIASSLSLIDGVEIQCIVIMVNAETLRSQANDRYVGDTIRRQLTSADILVINKIDTINHEQLVSLRQWCSEGWPQAKQICAEQSAVPSALFLEKVVGFATDAMDIGNAGNSALSHAALFTTFNIEISTPVCAEPLAQYLASESCQLVRAKGFVIDQNGSLKLIQVVGRRFRLHDDHGLSPGSVSLGIVCIGLSADIDKHDVKSCLTTFIGKRVYLKE